jgi:hypothetical protein
MKNKAKYFYKNSDNILNINENAMNTISDSNINFNYNQPNSKKSNNNLNKTIRKNSSEIFSSNGLSFLIYSSNKETNKHKKDVLFGNLLSLSKEKAKLQFNSYLRDSIQKTNSLKNINKYLENNINGNSNYLTAEKNKLKLNESQLRQLSSIKNKNYDTMIKREYENFLENGIDFSLNDYLNSYKNDDNFDNNFSNGTNPHNNSSKNNKINSNDKNSPDDANKINKSCLFKTNENIKDNINNTTLGVITEEKHKDSKFNAILNETLFNTRIKEKISKIKEDIYINNNLKQKNKEASEKNNSKKYLNHKLRVDQNVDYYDFLSNELDKMDEAKLLEDVFSEFLSEIKFKFWKKESLNIFKESLNNCKLYDLLKLNEIKDSNYFEKYISSIDLTTNKNLSNSIYNSKSEPMRDGSHSFNDSQSSQTIENQQEKNYPLISKFPKLVIPQSIIPEESSNFLYSNNENVLNRSVGEPLEENNLNELGDIVECEEDNIYEENIKKELDNIEDKCEINISHIFINMKMNNIFGEDTNFNSYDMIKEYKAKIFYDILLIAQESDVDISQKNNFGKIIKGII